MIILATVVFPDALPPPRPVGRARGRGAAASQMAQGAGTAPPAPATPAARSPGPRAPLTDGEGLLGLRAVLVVPGRPPRRVDGALAGAQQGRLRLALAGGAPPGRAAGPQGREQPVQGLGAGAAAAAVRRGMLAWAGHTPWGTRNPPAAYPQGPGCSRKLRGTHGQSVPRQGQQRLHQGLCPLPGTLWDTSCFVNSNPCHPAHREEWLLRERPATGLSGVLTWTPQEGMWGREADGRPLRLVLQRPAHTGEQGGGPKAHRAGTPLGKARPASLV